MRRDRGEKGRIQQEEIGNIKEQYKPVWLSTRTRLDNSYTFSTGEYADVYVNFRGDPGKITVGYSGGSASVSDDQFSLDTSYTDSVTLTGRTWSKTFNNLPLTGKENNTSYIYKYLVKEVSRINGFKTTYQIDNGEFTDTISESDAISQDGNHSIVIKNEKETTDFEFTKIWKNASGETEINWQKDISVSLNTQKGKVADFTLNELGGTNGEYTWTCTENADHTFTFKISNLPAYDSDGELTYYVQEESVDGYNEPIYAFIQNGTIVSKPDSDETKDRASDGQYIINMPVESYELPNTGGPGTKLITLLGSMLLLGAGMVLIMRRRITL